MLWHSSAAAGQGFGLACWAGWGGELAWFCSVGVAAGVALHVAPAPAHPSCGRTALQWRGWWLGKRNSSLICKPDPWGRHRKGCCCGRGGWSDRAGGEYWWQRACSMAKAQLKAKDESRRSGCRCYFLECFDMQTASKYRHCLRKRRYKRLKPRPSRHHRDTATLIAQPCCRGRCGYSYSARHSMSASRILGSFCHGMIGRQPPRCSCTSRGRYCLAEAVTLAQRHPSCTTMTVSITT